MSNEGYALRQSPRYLRTGGRIRLIWLFRIPFARKGKSFARLSGASTWTEHVPKRSCTGPQVYRLKCAFVDQARNRVPRLPKVILCLCLGHFSFRDLSKLLPRQLESVFSCSRIYESIRRNTDPYPAKKKPPSFAK